MAVNFRLIDSGWRRVVVDALRADHADLRVVCPFIKRSAAELLLSLGRPNTIRIVTRFNLADFYDGASDTAALRLLLENGAAIRGVRNLHAKLYVFGSNRVVVTSANLTAAALSKNHEFGFEADDPEIIAICAQYFDTLWRKAEPDLTPTRLDEWESRISLALSAGSRPVPPLDLGDAGVDVGTAPPPVALPEYAAEASQWFVKFFGESKNRAESSMSVIEELQRSGSHWAFTYPNGKRPRRVKDGAVMFPARIVKDPADIIIYGRVIGMRHRDGLDDASEGDIAFRPWKAKWPHYVRVHHGQFVAGTLSNGVSLNGVMAALGADVFATTKRNAAIGVGNADPRQAYRQQAAVELTPEGSTWIQQRLEAAFAQYGTLTPTDMQDLDWPAT